LTLGRVGYWGEMTGRIDCKSLLYMFPAQGFVGILYNTVSSTADPTGVEYDIGTVEKLTLTAADRRINVS